MPTKYCNSLISRTIVADGVMIIGDVGLIME